MGKYFDDLFVSLGGKRVFTLGVGDSKDNTTEDSFDQWRTELWPAIQAFYNPAGKGESEKPKPKKEAGKLPLTMTFVDGPTEETDPKSLSMAARQLSISKRINIASIKEVR